MRKLLSIVGWGGIAALGAAGFAVLALHRGETINAAWLLYGRGLHLRDGVPLLLAVSRVQGFRAGRQPRHAG